MKRNVGGFDRTIRGVLGCWLLVVAIAASLDDRRQTAITAAIAGAGLLFNWASGFCGGNALLGIDTRRNESCSLE